MAGLLDAVVHTQRLPLPLGDPPPRQRIGPQQLQPSALRLGIEVEIELDDDRTVVHQRLLKGADPIETTLERLLATHAHDAVVDGGTVPGVEKEADPSTWRQRPPVSPERWALTLFVGRQVPRVGDGPARIHPLVE